MDPALTPSLFRCPLCSSPLHRDTRGYRCPNGHCFDVAAAGYTHLLPANKKHSKNPGDDKEMVAARSISGCRILCSPAGCPVPCCKGIHPETDGMYHSGLRLR